MHYLRSEFSILHLDRRIGEHYADLLRQEWATRPWFLNPSVEWDELAKRLRITFESPIESADPPEPPILTQLEQLRACFRLERTSNKQLLDIRCDDSGVIERD
jgi:hypothetical protein